RNTFILRLIKLGLTEDDLVSRMGFKTKISLKRYYQYSLGAINNSKI
ncbi:integrase, partial [Bacillus cereus]|nr:integrase [Bacillus cereus]